MNDREIAAKKACIALLRGINLGGRWLPMKELTFVVRGSEIYLRCPNGVARSQLTAQYFDSRLKTITTARNWRTVLDLPEMARTH